MVYKVTLRKRAMKVLEKINEPNYSKIKSAIHGLADNPYIFNKQDHKLSLL